MTRLHTLCSQAGSLFKRKFTPPADQGRPRRGIGVKLDDAVRDAIIVCIQLNTQVRECLQNVVAPLRRMSRPVSG
jgi:hypothetical protein